MGSPTLSYRIDFLSLFLSQSANPNGCRSDSDRCLHEYKCDLHVEYLSALETVSKIAKNITTL